MSKVLIPTSIIRNRTPQISRTSLWICSIVRIFSPVCAVAISILNSCSTSKTVIFCSCITIRLVGYPISYSRGHRFCIMHIIADIIRVIEAPSYQFHIYLVGMSCVIFSTLQLSFCNIFIHRHLSNGTLYEDFCTRFILCSSFSILYLVCNDCQCCKTRRCSSRSSSSSIQWGVHHQDAFFIVTIERIATAICL